MKNYLIILLSIFFLFGCSEKEQNLETNVPINSIDLLENQVIKNGMQKVSFSEINGFFEDDLNYALEVFRKDCQKAQRFEELKNICAKANDYEDGAMFFISNFNAYRLYDNQLQDEGTITGYYEPLLYGSLKKSKKYKYPVYKIPKDLIVSDDKAVANYKGIGKIKGKRVVPYDTRKEIEKRKSKNLEVIAYVDNKVDLFFLHIQGSGKIKLEDQRVINVGYAGQNGRPYRSIGKYLMEKGYMTSDDMSVQAMKKFFNKNPSKVDSILNINESYVFFTQKDDGATGALGSVLTAKRNLAVDRNYIPLGFPVFLNTQNPVSKEPINKLMVAADVGGAIKGEIRADFFWGFGDDALEYAGRMKEKGKMYVLKPKD